MLSVVLAILAPGQGSQSPGMLAPWLDLPGAKAMVDEFSEIAQLDLLRLGTTAAAAEIKDTAITQPLIVALGLLAAADLDLDGSPGSVIIAGHSVGEITAAAIAGVISPQTAVDLAARRGAAMAAACALAPTGMSAVLGGDPEKVIAGIEALGLVAANRNGAGQVVAAGAVDSLAALAQSPPGGARVRPLEVAGAFHTPYMAPAKAELAGYATNLETAAPAHILLSNADGAAVTDGGDVIARLVDQVSRPVRWDLCQRSLRDLGVTAVIELPPAGTLSGLGKRELPGVTLLAIRSPEDIETAQRMMRDRPQHGQGEYTPEFQVVVSPTKGVFTHTGSMAEGDQIRPGAVVGIVKTNRGEQPVVAGSAGILVEWLRQDSDIVNAGVPIARLSSGSEH
jgi:[acyl-carrier-protein] S-malonyltransferase